jgi:hypothetical protein
MRALSAEGLLQRPVRLRGLRLGQPTDVVLETGSLRAVGFEVSCGDGAVRFLPFPAARIEEAEITIGSAFQLLDERDTDFYRRRATSLRSLQRLPVEREGRPLGTLADVLLAGDGAALELVVEAEGKRLPVPFAATVSVGGRRGESAA